MNAPGGRVPAPEPPLPTPRHFQHRTRQFMMTRRLVPLLAAAAIAGAAVSPLQAQTPQLALNSATVQPAPERNTWRLTLEFGRADRSASASARSVHAPALAAHDFVISTADGTAAPFIVRGVEASGGNALTLVIEYFGPTPLVASDRFTVTVLEDGVMAAGRESAEFDFLPPSLSGG
jgi:hypothetical protein